MCTVSFISRNNRYFITSNRDEHISRPLAFEPQEEVFNSIKVLFPKDPKAGGTWFAINENGYVGVLLNGAFVRHKSRGNYAKSRGLVLLDVISSQDPESELEKMELNAIEPFTLVLFNTSNLIEFRWDGQEKHFKTLNTAQSYIWSSVTLYDELVIHQREQLFEGFLEHKTDVDAADVIDFHSNNHEDYENGFIIDRETGLKTFSVTQAVIQDEDALLRHIDLFKGKLYEVPMSGKPITVPLK